MNLSKGVIEGAFHKAKLEVESWQGDVLGGAKVSLKAVGEHDPKVEVKVEGLKDYPHVRGGLSVTSGTALSIPRRAGS